MPGLNGITKKEITSSGTLTSQDALELLKKDFPYHCRNLRTSLRISLAKMAYLMGVGESADNRNRVGKMTISRWESGAHVPQDRYLRRFLEIQAKYDAGEKVKI